MGVYVKKAMDKVKDKVGNLQEGPFKAMKMVFDEDTFVRVRAKSRSNVAADPAQITS